MDRSQMKNGALLTMARIVRWYCHRRYEYIDDHLWGNWDAYQNSIRRGWI